MIKRVNILIFISYILYTHILYFINILFSLNYTFMYNIKITFHKFTHTIYFGIVIEIVHIRRDVFLTSWISPI